MSDLEPRGEFLVSKVVRVSVTAEDVVGWLLTISADEQAAILSSLVERARKEWGTANADTQWFMLGKSLLAREHHAEVFDAMRMMLPGT